MLIDPWGCYQLWLKWIVITIVVIIWLCMVILNSSNHISISISFGDFFPKSPVVFFITLSHYHSRSKLSLIVRGLIFECLVCRLLYVAVSFLLHTRKQAYVLIALLKSYALPCIQFSYFNTYCVQDAVPSIYQTLSLKSVSLAPWVLTTFHQLKSSVDSSLQVQPVKQKEVHSLVLNFLVP